MKILDRPPLTPSRSKRIFCRDSMTKSHIIAQPFTLSKSIKKLVELCIIFFVLLQLQVPPLVFPPHSAMTKTGRRDSQCHERTSLLVDTQSLTRTPLDDEEQILSSASSSSTQTLTSTPVPWRAVSVILILNGIQPLAYELVFPFISNLSPSMTYGPVK